MEVSLGDVAFDIDFHPSQQLVATALINGYLHLYRYASDSSFAPQSLRKVDAHSESCRAVRFINQGQAVVTGSTDCSIRAMDVETGSRIAHLENAHEDAINKLINLTESTIASGDDSGCIMVWDIRQRSHCNTFKGHADIVSDLAFAADYSKLLGTSGDGTLYVCNLRRNTIEVQSESSDEDLQSVVIMKNGRKAVCSSNMGTLFLYSWGCFNDWSDRFVDFCPYSVDALLKVDEDRIITGSMTGLISLVGILPNRVIQPIADHSEHIEGLAISHDKKFLGSIGHDGMLKLWDMEEILQDSGVSLNSKAGTKRKNASKDGVTPSSQNFFTDLEMNG